MSCCTINRLEYYSIMHVFIRYDHHPLSSAGDSSISFIFFCNLTRWKKDGYVQIELIIEVDHSRGSCFAFSRMIALISSTLMLRRPLLDKLYCHLLVDSHVLLHL